jgi:hypothetical protein
MLPSSEVAGLRPPLVPAKAGTQTGFPLSRERTERDVIARSGSDEAIQGPLALSAGLLRSARNDDHSAASSRGAGGVPWVWNDSMVFSPQAWPFFRSASFQTMVFQSGARISRAPALATSTRLPPGS